MGDAYSIMGLDKVFKLVACVSGVAYILSSSYVEVQQFCMTSLLLSGTPVQLFVNGHAKIIILRW